MSGFTTTPNYNLVKPTPGADDDQWGGHLNGNADTLDTLIKSVENKANTVPTASTTLPGMDGAAAIGVGTTYARADHIHPTDTSRAAVSAIPTASTTLPLVEAGAGAIGVSAMYARSDHVHPSGGAAGASVSIADTPPATPAVGDMWWDSVGTQLYLRYNDGNTTQWVPATNQTGGVGEAASDGYQYARRNAAWSRVATPDVGRNLIHNAPFTVAQRGAGPTWPAPGYTLDRWSHFVSSDTISITQAAVTDAQRAAIGDEAAVSCYANVFTGNAAAGAYNLVVQRIEGVRRLGGKTVTVSFWAVAASGTPKLGVSINQLFGTGGSPSADVQGVGQAVTISTTFTRYSLTFTLASTAGKTLGTAGNDCTQLAIWYSSGTTNATSAGNIGVQSGTIQIWGVQLEIGSVATPLEKRDPALELRQCQRFFYVGYVDCNQIPAATGIFSQQVSHPVTMRANPAFVFSGTLYGNASGITAYNSDYRFVKFGATAAASGGAYFTSAYTASADL